MVIFAETVPLIKLASLLCIILGIIGLKTSACPTFDAHSSPKHP